MKSNLAFHKDRNLAYLRPRRYHRLSLPRGPDSHPNRDRKPHLSNQLLQLDSHRKHRDMDSLFKADKELAKADSIHKAKLKEKEEYKPAEHQVKVYFAKDTPKGTILLQNARIITMKDEEVIENGDILIENNRIKAVGKTGTLNAGNAKVIDAKVSSDMKLLRDKLI